MMRAKPKNQTNQNRRGGKRAGAGRKPGTALQPAIGEKPLNPKRQRFVELFLVSLNATQAYREVYGCAPKTAEANGAKLLRNAKVASAIRAGQQAKTERTNITADAVLRELWAIATADANELCELRRVPCRYCYGEGHRYQFTSAEIERERAAFEERQTKKSRETFDERGGIGYTTKRQPCVECPECFGAGEERPYFHDTRTLSYGARRLYAGVKVTRDGLEVKLHDKANALAKVGEHLGMFRDHEPPQDATDLARRVREALRAIASADGLTA